MPLHWPFPSLLSVSFGLCREYPWGLSSLSVNQGYKAAFKCRFAHFSCCFFREVLLRCRLRAGLGGIVPCILCCIAGCPQPGWAGHRQNTGTCCSPCQTELSFQNNMALSDAQDCEAEYICLGSWFFLLSFFSTWHHGWWQKVTRNTWKKGVRCYSSPLLGLCAVDKDELAPVCHICATASLPGAYRRTLVKHYMIEKIRYVSR